MKYLKLIAIVILMAGCTKENEGVYVRIQNTSSTVFNNISVSGVQYGKVEPENISEYKLIPESFITPGCLAEIDKKGSFYIGILICGTPPLPPPYGAGKYTFKITSSSTAYTGYDIKLINE